ncbi:hypothetical protein [Coraliomargarita parva]|uniref:hypothetical protein n=1 Tax=Coraliomargarita parva TaxID=3014050 RepID=UPI0022B4439C|nr:hypothetical protein [Coraliomargarita parva]
MKCIRLQILSFLSLCLFTGCQHVASQLQPKHEGTRILHSDELYAEVVDPDSENPYHQGLRFSPVAHVLSVFYKGHEFLYNPVAHNSIKDGGGLAMEFDLFHRGYEFGPPGYMDAEEGAPFMKIGIGLLNKNGPKYASYNHCYDVFQLAKTEVEWRKDSAVYTQQCPTVNGYGYELKSWLSLEGNRIEVHHRLTNTGSRSFFTLNYVHNFLQFDGKNSVKGYEVSLPYEFDATIATKGVILQDGRKLTFVDEVTPKMKGASAKIEAFPADRLEETIYIDDPALGMSMKVSVSEPAWRVTIHGGIDSLSPEQFIRLDLSPGESKEWVRQYIFKVR